MTLYRTFTRLAILIMIGAAACSLVGSQTPTLSVSSGIEGFITEGPTCPGPVQVGSTDCADRPYQAALTVLDARGVQVTRFQSGKDGYFRLPLDPGTYILHPVSIDPFPFAADQTVEVHEGQYTRVSILFDTGMR